MSSSRIFRLVLVSSAAVACSSQSASTTASPATAIAQGQPAPSRNRDVIGSEELSDPARRAQTVIDVIRSLRPQFLTVRGNTSPHDEEAGKVHASIDNGSVVSLDELRNIHVNQVVEIRYLSVAQAMAKFGGAAREGPVIVVRTTTK